MKNNPKKITKGNPRMTVKHQVQGQPVHQQSKKENFKRNISVGKKKKDRGGVIYSSGHIGEGFEALSEFMDELIISTSESKF